ncbi:MAG: universal stress protein [Bacteroidota bacterium]
MIKKILLPMDFSEYSVKSLELAGRIARFHNAELTALVVLDIPGIERSIGPIPAGAEFYARKLEKARIDEAQQRINDLIARFKSYCDENGIRHAEHHTQGIPSGQILEESKFFDLLVIGLRTYYRFGREDSPGDTFDEILDHSITPVLAVPKQFHAEAFSERPIRAVLAFDSSLPACRAMQRFAQLAVHGFVDLKIVMSHEDTLVARHNLESARSYMQAHFMDNIEIIHTTENIIKVINNQHIEWADIIALGAHTKKGILDFMVGSLTRFLIQEERTAIFIGQ